MQILPAVYSCAGLFGLVRACSTFLQTALSSYVHDN
jgi:hypothetical protein